MATRLSYPTYQIGAWTGGFRDDAGVSWWVETSDIEDGLDPKTHITERANGAGAFRAKAYMSGKSFTISGLCEAFDRASRDAARSQLMGLFDDGGQALLTYNNGASTRTLLVELNGKPRFTPLATPLSPWQLPLYAADGRFLDAVVQTAGPVSVGGASTDGLDWLALGGIGTGLDWLAVGGVGTGLDWGTSGNGGVLTLANAGNAEAWPVFTVVGPLTAPSFTDPASGRTIAYSGVVGSGQTLTIDTSPFTRSVKLDGVDRSSLLTSAQWFSIPPGGSVTVQCGGSGGGTFAASWQNATI